MNQNHALMRDQIEFLGQDPERLRAMRGSALYENLSGLGLTYPQYFRAVGTNVEDYCAQEFGIDLNRITVERFFQTDPNTKWLFPDIVRESVLAGMRQKPRYPELIIHDEPIQGAVYDVPYVRETPDEETLRQVSEGAAIPESSITYGNRVVRLDKRGRGVLASYEVIRRMSVNMLRVHLRRMGEQLGRNLDARLADILANGDGVNPETAPVTINTMTAGQWRYDDLLHGFTTLTLGHYFTPTHLLANAETLCGLLAMDNLRDALLFDFAKTGNLPTPLGVKLVPMADQPAGKLTILDAGYAAQKLTEQDLLVESDKLIHQQWDRTYLTVVTDFAIIYAKARIVLNSDWN